MFRALSQLSSDSLGGRSLSLGPCIRMLTFVQILMAVMSGAFGLAGYYFGKHSNSPCR
jgi:hypothetical protein